MAKRKPPVIGTKKAKALISSKGKRVRRTKNFADVVRGMMTEDPHLAAEINAAIERESRREVSRRHRRATGSTSSYDNFGGTRSMCEPQPELEGGGHGYR